VTVNIHLEFHEGYLLLACCFSRCHLSLLLSVSPQTPALLGMNGPPSLNQSITAAWGTAPSAAAVATKKRIKRTNLNSPVPSAGPSSDPSTPQTSGQGVGESSDRDRDRAPTPRRKRARPDPSQLSAKYAPPDLKLASLGGLRSQITQLMEIVVLPLLHPEIYLHTGVPRPRGVLLHGVPGGGKTQLVKCLAGVGQHGSQIRITLADGYRN
jgi:ribosome biogenesis ATPase